MNELTNTIQNNVLATYSTQAPKSVVFAIQDASENTGVDFAYLMQQASAESSFDPNAKAKTSSATGLYQFIESTWMNMIDKHGQNYGIETQGKSRKDILELRKDPKIASHMAAEFASENEKFLETHWAKGEKEIGSTELYLAHFMGASGAAGFLNARDENPMQKAAYIFPEAAQANRNVFYEANNGRARSFDEVYAFFDKKFQIKPSPQDVPLEKPQVEEPAVSSEQLLAFGLENSGFKDIAQRQEHITSRVFNSGFKQLESIYGTNTQPISPYQSLVHAPIEIMMLAQLDLPNMPDIERHNDKSLF